MRNARTIRWYDPEPPTEEEEQIALMGLVAMQQGRCPELKLLFHIPNGGKRGKCEAARFKAMGVKSGVPDLFLPVARGGYHGLWVELKRTKDSRVSANQNEWIKALRQQGYSAEVAYGAGEAMELIEGYLSLRKEERK